MPRYGYLCDDNGVVVEVMHGINEQLLNWGELCERARVDPGGLDPCAPVRKVILQAPMANTPTGDSDLKNMGFSKLVKRDDGVYENVTRTGTESRYVKAGDSSTMPHFHKKHSS